MGESNPDLEPAPWRLIAVKGQAVPYEVPMYVFALWNYLFFHPLTS